MMNFSAWSIRNPVAPILAFFMLMVLGWQSFNGLPVTRFPNIDVPLVSVTVTQAGAAPAEMETQVTKEIEDAVAGIAGVKNVNSTVSDGVSTTVVEFRMEVPTEKAVQDTKDAIDQILRDLPGDADQPIVARIDVEGQAIMTFAVSNQNLSLEQLSWFVDDTVIRALQGKAGIGRVDRYGGADREIRVELDPARLDSFGVTAAAVSQQLRATNANIGAGRAKVADGEQTIRTLGDAQTAARLADTTIALPSGRFVRVSQLGQVVDTYAEQRSFSRFDGNQVVTFAVFRAKGASEVSVANTVDTALTQLRKDYPDFQITPVDETVSYTLGNYTAAIDTLLEGALLAVLVVLAFLRNWRATVIAAVALPLSAVPTFWVMDLLGFSLNLVSFLAITLATGILVDDAIVEIENIARHIRMGKTPYRAAIDAADEIGLAVIATSSTIVAVFVPVSFMPGVPGQYFRQFGLTVAIAVIFSLLVARLITPLMAAYLMRAKDAAHEEHKDGIFMRGYLGLIGATIRSKPLPFGLRFPTYYLTLVVALMVFAFSIYELSRVPGSFIPPEDVSRIPISVELPPGSTLADTDRVTEAMRQAILSVDGVKDVFVLGGASPRGELDVRRASFTVLLDGLDHSLLSRLSDVVQMLPVIGPYMPQVRHEGRTRPQVEIEGEILSLLARIPDIRAFKLNDRGDRDIAYVVQGKDSSELDASVSKLIDALRGSSKLANVSAEGALPRPEIQITMKPDIAARLGVTTAAVAQTLRVATIGDYDAALAKVSIDNRQIPVRVELANGDKTDLAALGALKVATVTGTPVPLSVVADIVMSEGVSTIKRQNRDRQVTIGADLPAGVALNEAKAAMQTAIEAAQLPATVQAKESGDAEVQAEMVQSFMRSMILGLMLVLMVLILLFGSVIQPFTILLSLPLAIGGVAAALILTRSPLSMPVLIGILMLMGIVTKNAILLVDFAIEMRRQGMDRISALIEAGHKRAQPIVMTSIAMSAGMLPSALGVGEGGTFRAPMAIAVIGGIIVSTVLSLVVVPSFFLIMDDVARLLGWIFGRFVGRKDAEPRVLAQDEISDALAETRSELGALKGRIGALEDVTGQAKGPRLAAE